MDEITVKELAQAMIKAHGDHYELFFEIDGKRVNVEVKITHCVAVDTMPSTPAPKTPINWVKLQWDAENT